MNHTYRLIFFLAFVLLQLSAKGQTPITGGIYTNSTWTQANSPYVVSDLLTLFPDVTLTIEPGVEVRFNQDAKFEVRGTLEAIGTASDSIRFVSNLEMAGLEDWWGIDVRRDLEADCNFNFCKFKNAYRALNINSSFTTDEPFSLQNSVFEQNFTGMVGGPHSANQAMFLVDNCLFYNNYSGIGYNGGTAEFVVSNSRFENNTFGADFLEDMTFENCVFCGNIYGLTIHSELNIQACTFTNNRVAIWPKQSNRTSTFENCIIAENDTGLVLHSIISRPYVINQNKICNNRYLNVIQFGDYNENLSGNCWCTTDSLEIIAGNFDGYDNVDYGLIQFGPVWNCDTSFVENLPECSSLVGIDETTQPEGFYLSQNFPNPSSTSSSVEFLLPRPTIISLLIYDLNGRVVQRLVSQESLPAGKHQVEFSVESLPSGIYYYSVFGNSTVETKKMVVLR